MWSISLWGGVEYSSGMEYSGGMEVSSVEQPAARQPGRSPPHLAHQLDHDLAHRLSLSLDLGCILVVVDDVRGLMDGPCDVDVSSSFATMRWSSPIERKTDLPI